MSTLWAGGLLALDWGFIVMRGWMTYDRVSCCEIGNGFDRMFWFGIFVWNVKTKKKNFAEMDGKQLLKMSLFPFLCCNFVGPQVQCWGGLDHWLQNPEHPLPPNQEPQRWGKTNDMWDFILYISLVVSMFIKEELFPLPDLYFSSETPPEQPCTINYPQKNLYGSQENDI